MALFFFPLINQPRRKRANVIDSEILQMIPKQWHIDLQLIEESYNMNIKKFYLGKN